MSGDTDCHFPCHSWKNETSNCFTSSSARSYHALNGQIWPTLLINSRRGWQSSITLSLKRGPLLCSASVRAENACDLRWPTKPNWTYFLQSLADQVRTIRPSISTPASFWAQAHEGLLEPLPARQRHPEWVGSSSQGPHNLHFHYSVSQIKVFLKFSRKYNCDLQGF